MALGDPDALTAPLDRQSKTSAKITSLEGKHLMGLLTTTGEWRGAAASWKGIQDAPAAENRKRLRGFRVLENGFLERFLVTSHWVMPGVWYLPLMGFFLYSSSAYKGLSVSVIVGCVVVGTLAWTLIEYLLHRFLFHCPPTRVPGIRYLFFILHGYHHEFPNDPGRLVAPPILSWPLAALFLFAFWAVLGVYWQAIAVGVFAGYLVYDWTHYYTHHARPKSRAGKYLRRYHLEHHYKDSKAQFGISSPLWDLILGTYRRLGEPTAEEVECADSQESAGRDEHRIRGRNE